MPTEKKYEMAGGGFESFADLLAEVYRAFEIEKNAKNMAYAFIVLNGHEKAFMEWRANNAPADPWDSVLEHLDEVTNGGERR